MRDRAGRRDKPPPCPGDAQPTHSAQPAYQPANTPVDPHHHHQSPTTHTSSGRRPNARPQHALQPRPRAAQGPDYYTL
ncbi:hypothetical protein BD413DRAFT_520157, partial [Trametes elegans]